MSESLPFPACAVCEPGRLSGPAGGPVVVGRDCSGAVNRADVAGGEIQGLVNLVAGGGEHLVGVGEGGFVVALELAGDENVAELRDSVDERLDGRVGLEGERVGLAADEGVGEAVESAGAQADAPLVGAAVVADERDVVESRIRHRSSLDGLAVVVALEETVAGRVGLVGHEPFALAVPPFGPVEAVVGAIDNHAVSHVHASAEELDAVIRAHIALDV